MRFYIIKATQGTHVIYKSLHEPLLRNQDLLYFNIQFEHENCKMRNFYTRVSRANQMYTTNSNKIVISKKKLFYFSCSLSQFSNISVNLIYI